MGAQSWFPKIHNAMWPGLVGKGPGAEPFIDFDTMLQFTATAEVNGSRFDGVDLFLAEPHVSIDAVAAELKPVVEKIAERGLRIGSLVAPVWPNTGGGSAMGDDQERGRFVSQVEKACKIGQFFRDSGIRTYGVIRIDSAGSPATWAKDPDANTTRVVDTFRRAADVAERYDERLAAEGEICWGAMHSWRTMADTLRQVNRPETVGFQADIAHTLLYAMGHNAPDDRLLPDPYNWRDPQPLKRALQQIVSALGPWTTDVHVAQNDATVNGTGSHDKTGRHCLPDDPNGKLDIVSVAGMWLAAARANPNNHIQHICWDGCMFPNSVMYEPTTWQKILATMLAVREAHGWAN